MEAVYVSATNKRGTRLYYKMVDGKKKFVPKSKVPGNAEVHNLDNDVQIYDPDVHASSTDDPQEPSDLPELPELPEFPEFPGHPADLQQAAEADGAVLEEQGRALLRATTPVEHRKLRTDCLFGDGPGEMRRVVHGELYWLCESHYYNTTLGELVQFLRERQERVPVSGSE